MVVLKAFLMLLLKVVFQVEAVRILAYYPCPSISHQVVFRPITLELLKLGHQVTVITPDPMFTKGNSPANLTEIDVHDVSYKIIKKHVTASITGKQGDLANQIQAIMNMSPDLIEEQFKSQEVINLLRNENVTFDLLLLEAYFTPALGLTHKFNAPTILISSLGAYPGNYETVGGSTHPTIYPDLLRQRLYNLTLWEKLMELLNTYIYRQIINDGVEKENIVLQKIFGSDIPPIKVLRNNVDMLFLNINPIWEGNYPMPPSVIHMGGLHQNPSNKLPKALQKYLDDSQNGVIYFSLGTNISPSLLPTERIAIFEKVFSQLPYDVIWKWDNENFIVKSKNIKLFQWLPQSDLLRHPNVKLFITQGGLQSTDEAIRAGVPLIGIPMLADQWYNVEKYVYHKIGVRLDFEDITENRLRAAIVEVVEVESYRENIARLRSLMQDQPQTAHERAISWIEYVLKQRGAKHLRTPAANMSWVEYLELELVVLIVLVQVIILILTYAVIKFLISFTRKRFFGNLVFRALFKFRNDSGDLYVQKHLRTAPENATYRIK